MSTTEARIRKKFEEGGKFTANELALSTFCCLGHAGRIINKLLNEKFIRVCAWHRSGKDFARVFQKGTGENARRPKPKTNAQNCKKYRKNNPDVSIKNNSKNKAIQLIAKIENKTYKEVANEQRIAKKAREASKKEESRFSEKTSSSNQTTFY